jgi:hypothetical protein
MNSHPFTMKLIGSRVRSVDTLNQLLGPDGYVLVMGTMGRLPLLVDTNIAGKIVLEQHDAELIGMSSEVKPLRRTRAFPPELY